MSEVVKADKNAKRMTKTEIVRNIMMEIGALTKNPPEGWKKKVDEALAKANVKIHPVSIYQIRSKFLNGKKKPAKTTAIVAVKPQKTEAVKQNVLKVSDLLVVNEFAKKYGGLSKLKEAIQAIELFSK